MDRDEGIRGLDKTALVFGQMNEPPGARMRVAETGLTMAEYFRDREHQNVLLFIDNIFRFPGRLRGFRASGTYAFAVGYQPTLATEMGELQERITSTKNGSVTSVQAVYVPADDLTDPAPATTFAHLDATTVLSRKIVEQGSILRSIRWNPPPVFWKLTWSGRNIMRWPEGSRRFFRSTKSCRISSRFLVWRNWVRKTRRRFTVPERFRNFCPSRSHVAENFTGKGKYVPLKRRSADLKLSSTARWTSIRKMHSLCGNHRRCD